MQEIQLVNDGQAKLVLSSIDKLIRWAKDASTKYEMGMMRLASLLMESHRGAYWTFRGYSSEEQYIKETFPQSRSNYYTLISIAEHLLPHIPQKQLEEYGRSKCEDLVRIQKHCGVVPANWGIHAKEDDKETFHRRVRVFLNDNCHDDGPSSKIDPRIEDQFMSFRLLGDMIIVVRKALDIIGQMIGSEKSMAQRLELLCAYFLSGFSEEGEGHVRGRNGLLFIIIQGCIEQFDLNEGKCGDRVVGIVAASIRNNSGTNGTTIQDQNDQSSSG